MCLCRPRGPVRGHLAPAKWPRQPSSGGAGSAPRQAGPRPRPAELPQLAGLAWGVGLEAWALPRLAAWALLGLAGALPGMAAWALPGLAAWALLGLAAWAPPGRAATALPGLAALAALAQPGLALAGEGLRRDLPDPPDPLRLSH